MATIERVNNRPVIDYMARDYESFKQAMVDMIPTMLPEWTDRSEADFGIVLIELFAYMADILSYYQDRIANESFLATARERRSVIQHLRLIGYEMDTASAASAMLTLSFVVDNSKTGEITIKQGDQFCTKSTKEHSAVLYEYTESLPLKIDQSNLVLNSGGQGKKKYQSGQLLADGTKAPYIPVKEGRLREDEILGISDGTPDQVFQLAQPKVLRESINLRIMTGNPSNNWLCRDNLVYSDPSDEHYFIQTDENDITRVYFGNGSHGKIPEKGAQIRATYRVGGGVHGNVGPNMITVISNASGLQNLAAKVTNEEPATGGEERASIDRAVRYAPTVFKSRRRAVTREDYVALAKQFSGVAKAKAEVSSWNYIDLYIAPAGGEVATDLLKRDLLSYFEDLRMMTTLIRIKDPIYVPIYITAEVNVKSYYFQEDVKNQIEKSIDEEVLNFDELDFGKPVYLSKVYEAIENIEGVDFVNVSEFCRDNAVEFFISTDSRYDMERAIASQGIIDIEKYELPGKGHIRTILKGGY